ncbi:MAG: fused MFS/spermidine synthase [Pseudomonadota bacterium]
MQRPRRDVDPISTISTTVPAATPARRGGAALYAIMVLSGFAGLGYEMVWSKMLAVALGHEIVSVLAVIAAFFVGLALGAWLLDGPVRRSASPRHWYAALELVIGVWALLLIVAIPLFNDVVPALIGQQPSALRHWGVVFVSALVLLLPATAAMGATLPVMERLYTQQQHTRRAVGGLYAANTFGAVAGTLVTTFFVAPALGYSTTLLLLACVNFACAAAVLVTATAHVGERDEPRPAAFVGNERLALTLFMTGLIGIGYEVGIMRMLSQILENTVYTFACLLAVYLFGTAVGAAGYQRWRPRAGFEAVLSRLLLALASACGLGTVLLWAAQPLHGFLVRALGDGYVAAIGGELLVATTVFVLPTILMGA